MKTENPSVHDFLTVLAAMHMSSYVQSRFEERGGIMLVGPPGVMKTTMVKYLDENYGDAIVVSDINVPTMAKMRDRIAGGSIRTLVFGEYGKLYERASVTAQNLEGTVRALAGEGFRSHSFEDSTVARKSARCTVIGAMTSYLRDQHSTRWDQTGFSRRFLWSVISLNDPQVIERAVLDDTPIEIPSVDAPRPPITGPILNLTTKEERHQIGVWTKYQPSPHTIQNQLLIKTWAVMKWWSRKNRRGERAAWHTLARFAKSLGKDGAELVVK